MTFKFKLFSDFNKLISPPQFAIEEKTRIARLLNTISLALMITAIIYLIFALLQTPIQVYRLAMIAVIIAIALITFILIRLALVKSASIFISVAALIFTTGVTVSQPMIKTVSAAICDSAIR